LPKLPTASTIGSAKAATCANTQMSKETHTHQKRPTNETKIHRKRRIYEVANCLNAVCEGCHLRIDTDTKMWNETHAHKKTLFLQMRSTYIKRDVHTKLSTARRLSGSVLQCVAVRCSVLQRVAACCSVLQCVVRVFVVDYQVCGGCSLRQDTQRCQKRPVHIKRDL